MYSRTLPHLPEILLPAHGLKEHQDHPCPVRLLQPNVQLKESRKTNELANALNTMPFRRRTLRRTQTDYPPQRRHNPHGVQYAEIGLRTRC